MTSSSDSGATTRCPSCAKPASGAFCTECGAQVSTAACRSCGKAVPAGSKFCPACGTAAGSGPGTPTATRGAGRPTWLPWAFGAALIAALIWLVVRQPNATAPAPEAGGPTTGTPAGPAPGAPPDISNMSPRERFNRLYERVITAARTGDQATVERFTPMAVQAYAMLDKVDADARYHLAMLNLHVGNLAGAQALSDTLIKQEPEHLFGYVIGAAVARFNKDDKGRAAMIRRFKDRYDAETRKGLPEYAEHQTTLADLRKAADSVTAK